MPRPKKPTETSITEALDTPVEQTIEEVADRIGVDPFRLQELFVERLGTDDPMVWLTIPTEHEPLLAEIKRSLESEASVRRFDIPTEPAELLPIVEPPIIQDSQQIEQKPHTEPSDLTQTKTEAIDQN